MASYNLLKSSKAHHDLHTGNAQSSARRDDKNSLHVIILNPIQIFTLDLIPTKTLCNT
jgi:hypothetical protein